MKREVSTRILLLKNNFYRDMGSTNEEVLGKYCALGHFDAFDISDEKIVKVEELDTWGYLGERTYGQNGNVNCRMLVCVTEQKEKDRDFWMKEAEPLVFITMVRLNEGVLAVKRDGIIEALSKEPKQMGYLSYDHSEIIAVTKTNQYSEGMKTVRKLRKICSAVKTYTIFGIREDILESYEAIMKCVKDEKVCCRLHCMIKNYEKAESFRKILEEHIRNREHSDDIEIRKFEVFGGFDWLLEVDNVSLCSLLELYKTKELLTHANHKYCEAFFNIESEILVWEGNLSCE